MPTPTSGGTATSVPYSGELLIDGLLIGTKWGGAVHTGTSVTYSFPDQNSSWSTDPNVGYDNPNSGWEPWDENYGGLNVTQQNAVRVALQAWARVANVNPVESADNAVVGDIRVAFTTGGDMVPEFYAYAYTPQNHAPYAGDVWLNPDPPVPEGNDFSTGAAGYATLLHELGHALGLDHPFGHEPSSLDLPAAYDNYKYTVMSYSDYSGHDDEGTSAFYPTTPMLLDIQALQYLYGPNTTYHTGNDTYTYAQGADYYQTIWDAGGIDTIRYNATTDGALIDLRAGQFSQLGKSVVLSDGTPQSDNVAIAYGVTLENAIGGDGPDKIIGNSGNNVLDGGAGVDTLSGGAGNDTLNGGSGRDTLGGGSGNDTMAGGPGNDTLDGSSGNDTMAGGPDNDTYIRDAAGDAVAEEPDAGIDRVKSAVTYTLGPNVENLTLTGADAVSGAGNTLDNVLTGNGAKNTLNGAGGDDVLQGLAGADVLIGGAGADRFDFDTVADSGIGASKRDTIKDFNAGDKIDLSTIDAKSATAGDDAFKFLGTKAFSTNASGQFRFDADLHLLLGSTDADGDAEFSIYLSGISSMTGSNFIL